MSNFDLDIKETIDNALKVEVLKAIEGAPEVINELIKSALSQPVNEYGDKPSSYDRGSAIPYLDWIVSDRIRNIARNAVDEALIAKADDIKKAVHDKIKAGDFADSVVTNLLSNLEESWRVNIRARHAKIVRFSGLPIQGKRRGRNVDTLSRTRGTYFFPLRHINRSCKG